MLVNKNISIIILIALLSLMPQLQAQSLGFGCLGFVGGFAGFTYQNYVPTGLNEFVTTFNSQNKSTLMQPLDTFGQIKGFRAGINLFRANFSGFILTAKGFYQSLTEAHSSVEKSSGTNSNSNYSLKLKTLGVGIDLGVSITEILSWKVLDGSINFNSAALTESINSPGNSTEIIYKSPDTKIGYSIGSGFIIDVISDYITVEGLAAYSFINFDKLQSDDENKIIFNSNNSTDLIEAGGFSAVIQLNVGFSL
ncbi:MAG TPA: hypothetical protein PKA80_00540 [Ignavibacteriaceae bacterium]|nr:hypothetical protein [Ignavibacteriaceae bacterium]